MNSIFGIGLPELFFIAIIALIVLGPERLPGAIREVAKFLKQVRALGNELTSQFSEELAFLDEMNPRRILEEATRPDQEEKPAAKANTKPKTSTAKTSTSNAAKPKAATPKPAASTTAKTTAAKSTTAKTEPAKSAADKPTDTAADKIQTADVQSTVPQSDLVKSDGAKSTAAEVDAAETAPAAVAASKVGPATVSAATTSAGVEFPNGKTEAETENSIAPPELMHNMGRDANKNGDNPSPKAVSAAAADSSSMQNGAASVKADDAPPTAVEADAVSAEKQV